MEIRRVEKPSTEPAVSVKPFQETDQSTETIMTEADIENFLNSAKQDLDDFVVTVRDSAAQIEMSGDELDQATNKGVLGIIRQARESYQKLESKIKRSLEVKRAKKQLATQKQIIWSASQTKPLSERIAIWKKTKPIIVRSLEMLPRWMEENVRDWEERERSMFLIYNEDMELWNRLIENNLEEAAKAYSEMSSLSWNDLLNPKNYIDIYKQQKNFRLELTNKLKNKYPNKKDRTEAITKLGLPELDSDKYSSNKHDDEPPANPQDLLKLIEDSVEQGRGMEYVLHGFDRENPDEFINKVGWNAFSEKTQQTIVDAYKNVFPVMFVYSKEIPISTLSNATEKELEDIQLAAESSEINDKQTVLRLLEMHEKKIVNLSKFSDYQIGKMFYHSVVDNSDPNLPLKVFVAAGRIPLSINNQIKNLITECYDYEATKRIAIIPPELRSHISSESIGTIINGLINNNPNSPEKILEFVSLIEESSNWNEVVKSMIPNISVYNFLRIADKLQDFIMNEIKANKIIMYGEFLKRIFKNLDFESLQKLTSIIGEPNPEEVVAYAKENYTALDLIRALSFFKEGTQRDALLKILSEDKNKYTLELLKTDMWTAWEYIKKLESSIGIIDWKEYLEYFLKDNDSKEFITRLVYNLDQSPKELISAAKNEIHKFEKGLVANLLQYNSYSIIINLETKVGINDWSGAIEISLSHSRTILNDLLKAMSHVPAGLSKIIKENSQALYSKMFIFGELGKMPEIEKYLNEPDWEQISKEVTDQIDIYSLANIQIENISGIQKHFPWIATLKRLKKLQATSSRIEHCPWRQELVPMANKARENNTLSFNNPEDAEIFYSFVKDFGSFHLPILLEVFTKLKRAKSIEDIDQKTKDLLIEVLGESAVKKAQNPETILNEVRKFKRSLQAEILEDKIPKKLMTEIGKEIFSALRGTTRWGQWSSLDSIVTTWKQTIEKNPKSAELPNGYEEKTYQVASQEEEEMSPEEKSEKEKQILDNKELQIRIKNITEILHSAKKIQDISAWWNITKENLIKSLSDQILKTQERINSTESKVAHKSMQKNIDRLKEQIDQILSISQPTDSSETSTVSLMHALAKLDIKELTAPLQELSALHLTNTASEDWKQSLKDIANINEVTARDVDNISELITQFLTEHYLNPNQQNHDQTQHSPFDEDMRKTLEKTWGVAGNLIKHPIVVATSKLRNITQGKNTGKSQDITYVPQRGLLKIFSGDLGDSCYTSKYQELAEDKHKKITAIAIVTNRGNSQERIEGSILFIEATKTNGEPILVVRANNPRENLLGKVNPNTLIESSLEYARFTATQRGIKNVGVIRDQASQASSNRPTVSSYYISTFTAENQVTLENEFETNFNGYNIWDPTKGHPVVEI